MKTTYQKEDIFLHYMSLDGDYVLATRDPEMKCGFFKIECSDIEDKKVLKQLKKKQNSL